MGTKYGDSTTSRAESDRNAQFAALAEPQRRRLLEYLLERHPEPVPLSVAVAHLTGLETADPTRVETALVHRHLPQLEDASLVSYDADSNHVRYSGDGFVREVLDLL